MNLPAIDMNGRGISTLRRPGVTVAVLDGGWRHTTRHTGHEPSGRPRRGCRYRWIWWHRTGSRSPCRSLRRRLGPTRFVAPRLSGTTTPLSISAATAFARDRHDWPGHQQQRRGGGGVDVKIMPVKVVEAGGHIFGSPWWHRRRGGQGIRYAADNGARVINRSIAHAGAAGSAPVVEDAIKPSVMRAFIAIAEATDRRWEPTEMIAEMPTACRGRQSPPSTAAATGLITLRGTTSSSPPRKHSGFGSGGVQQTLDLDLVKFTSPPERLIPPRSTRWRISISPAHPWPRLMYRGHGDVDAEGIRRPPRLKRRREICHRSRQPWTRSTASASGNRGANGRALGHGRRAAAPSRCASPRRYR